MSFTPLPDPLPPDPLPLLDAWLREAVDRLGPEHRNPSAMTLATCGADGRPDARVVLCRGLDAQTGILTFYTDRSSAKGDQLGENPYAACVFYWEELYRQIRIRGPVRAAADAVSDAYFDSRPLPARISASISRQSQPVASRAELEARYETRRRGLDAPDASAVERPEHWGGYHVWIERIELWVGRTDRLHDRARYARSLTPEHDAFAGSTWSAERLQP